MRRVAALVVCLTTGLTIATAPVARAASPPAWDLPFPQTMSYRTLSEDPSIKCGQTDAVFDQQVAAEHLDQYEIDVTTGHRGDCGRLKAEQFKRLHPEKMVIAYENPAADDPRTWPGGTWAGYYLMMNRTVAADAVTAQQTQIRVVDPAVFSVGDTAVMWSPSASDAYANSEWFSVKSIKGAVLTVKRDMFSTGARSYASPPLLAAASTGPGYPDPNFDYSDVAPVNPANGLRANQWMASNIIGDFAASSASAPTLDGVEFDNASWFSPTQNDNGSIKNVDCNGDGVIDYCNRADGVTKQVNSYGVGYDAFLRRVARGLTTYDTDPNRPPKMLLADGETGLRSLDTVDGAEFESYPTWDKYAYSSPALETLGVWQTQDAAPGTHLSYAFTKDITPAYPQVSPTNPGGCVTPANGGTCRNGEFRYGMASALVWGGASTYNNEASFSYPQPWDEEATIDQSTTGLAPGYLGRPLGDAVRTTGFQSANLTLNPNFDQNLASVTTVSLLSGAVAAVRDTTTAPPGSSVASLRLDVKSLTADPQSSDARVLCAVAGAVSPGEYTIDFWAKGASNTSGPQDLELGVGLDGATGAPEVVLLTSTWTHYYLQFDADTAVAKNASVRFAIGAQMGSYWLDQVHVHAGTAGLLTRQFTNGIVVLNDAFTAQYNVALPGGPYHHINGKQDRSVNNGTSVGSVLPVIDAKDGEVLLRG